ncbi:MAG: thioredoxin family protein [Bacteroidales bacterium]|nr:thioredoxin family protein [Candidatus Cacconaster equi]
MKKIFLKIFLAILSVAAPSCLYAQPVDEPVHWTKSLTVSEEGVSEVVLTGTIEKGWHIYALEMKNGEIGNPTTVTLSSGAQMVEEPVMTGDCHSKVEIRFKAIFPEGKGTITVEWQACDSFSCLPPSEEEFSAEADAVKTGKDSESGKSIWKIILEAIAWGFVALLTPCVFPMIPMTVSFFLKQNETHKGRGKFLATAFGLFIVALYTLPIAVIILITYLAGGSAVTADIFNWLATHWIPNILFFLIFMVFAASFFGAFEIVLPSWMVNSSDQKSNKGGLGGVFFVALTLVLVSFSCTGPIVGSVLIKSTQGQFWEPIVTMLAFSIAFALPFTVFAFAPSLLKKIPKSGSWLNSVKVVLGFIEVALGFKFLSVADQTYHWGILDREVYLAIWIVVFSLLGLYLLGKIRFKFDSPVEHLSVFRLILVIIDFTFVVYMIPGMWGAPLKALSGYLPPITTQDFNLDMAQQRADVPVEAVRAVEGRKYADFLDMPYGIEAFYDYEQAREYAVKEGKPLFIDFTGHGCVNCREMETRVWSDPRVLKLMKEEYVICALFADDKKEVAPEDWVMTTDGKVLKTLGKINSHFALTRFNVNAQPYYAILDPVTEEQKVPSRGYDLDVEKFLKFLQSGLENPCARVSLTEKS